MWIIHYASSCTLQDMSLKIAKICIKYGFFSRLLVFSWYNGSIPFWRLSPLHTSIRYKTFDQISFADFMVYSKLPVHPFWSHIEDQIDFLFADRLCEVLYTGRGQYPFAPSLKLKIHLVQSYYALSDRLTEEKIIGDLFIKRFLGLPVDFFGFDHSTIGLDRSRLGAPMFYACHLYILAQMYSKGLWGDKDEQWIIDSFPSNIGIAKNGAYRLIQQAIIRIVQHLKRSGPQLYTIAQEALPLDGMNVRLTSQTSQTDRMLAFSKLVAQAHGLLHWFESDQVTSMTTRWSSYPKSRELQAILRQVLLENSRPRHPEDPNSDESDGALTVTYEKIPRKERATNRIESVVNPDARIGYKSRSTLIRGYKVQNLCTTGGVVLETKVIPANEHDQDAMCDMVKGIQSFFHTTPSSLLGDTAYGHGKQRLKLATMGIQVVAPLNVTLNPTTLFDISKFTYNVEKDVYTCPNHEESVRKIHNTQLEGSQYYFDKKKCTPCPLRAACTTRVNGRTLFHSDYYNLYKQAKTFNESDDGMTIHKKRYVVERKNQELKNDCRLGKPKATGSESLQLKAWLAAIVVNLKHTIRQKVNPPYGLIRRARMV